MRLLLILEHGGWYSDLDMVFLREVSGLRNVISGDHRTTAETAADPGGSVGAALNNAAFHFDRGHPYVAACVRAFAALYNPSERLSGGPTLMTRVLRAACGLQGEGTISPGVFTPERCLGVNVLPQRSFYPVLTIFDSS